MALPFALRPEISKVWNLSSAASITSGFTASCAAPGQGRLIAVYLAPIDGTAITGSASMTVTVGGVAGPSIPCGPAAAGQSTGNSLSNGNQIAVFCSDGSIIKVTLGTGLTNAANGVLTFIFHAMSS